MKKKKATSKSCPKNPQSNSNNKPGKLISILGHFARGKRLHRYQAEKLGDHCLHTSVSGLQLKHHIRFSRRRVKVPNRINIMTCVMLYWLEGKDLEQAREIVGLRDAT